MRKKYCYYIITVLFAHILSLIFVCFEHSKMRCKMLYGNDSENNKIEPTPNTHAYCPDCNAELIAKCGSIKIWHWAHKANSSYCNYMPETEWHLDWKRRAIDCGHNVEVKIDNHITDIMRTDMKRVIELQHSSIMPSDIINRCETFKTIEHKIDWVFDLEDKYDENNLIFRQKDGFYTFKQKWQKSVLHVLFDDKNMPLYGRVFFDVGFTKMFRVYKLYSKGSGWGKFTDPRNVIPDLTNMYSYLGDIDNSFGVRHATTTPQQ